MSMYTKSGLRRRGLALAVLGAVAGGALVSPIAGASGFQINENTAKALGRAYAGRETAGGDASVVLNNPAAMADLSGYVLQVDATAIGVSTQFSGSGSDAIGRPLSGGDGGNGGDINPVPAISFVMPVADNLRLGFGVDAPFGLKTSYDANWMGRYQAIKSTVKSIDYVGSVAWAVNPQFSLGLSVIAQKTTVDLSNAVDFGALLAGMAVPGFLPQSADGTAEVRGDDWAWGWQIGAEFKPTAQDRIAIDYHARIKHTISGNAYFTVPASVQYVFTAGGLPVFKDTGASGDLDTPATASVSYWHQTPGPIGWGAELGWTGWSSFDRLAINFDNPAQPPSNQPENWRDTIFGSVGMDYRMSDEWTWRAGVAFDQTPTRDSTRDPRIPDNARRWIALGATWAPSDNTEFDIGYAHLFVDNGDVNDTSATGDHLVGSFSNHGDLLGVSGQFRF
jgi:long-chain fatty acid transport protein